MTSSDLTNVIRLARNSPEIQTGTSAAQFYSEGALRRWTRSRSGIALAAEVGDAFAGFLLALYSSESTDSYLSDLVVAPEFRRQGVGGLLMAEAIHSMRLLGADHVYCLVKGNNAGMLKLCEHQGFELGQSFVWVERML